jgi:hypothetical protein
MKKNEQLDMANVEKFDLLLGVASGLFAPVWILNSIRIRALWASVLTNKDTIPRK